MTTGDEYTEDMREAKILMSISAKHDPMKSDEEKVIVSLYYNSKYLIMSLLKAKCYNNLLYELIRFNCHIFDQLVLRNLRLVIKQARKYMGRGIALVDLIYEGIEGLMYAIKDKYDPERGFKLGTYCTWWIRQKIGRAIENKSRLVKIPGHVLSVITKLQIVYKNYTVKHDGESPSPEDISDLMNIRWPELAMTPERVSELGRYQFLHTSLDDDGDEGGSTSMMDFLTYADNVNVEDIAEANANKDYVYELLAQLSPDEKKLITWKFGLVDYNTKRTTKEMALIMELDLKDYKNLESATMNKLRELACLNKVNF